MKLNIIKDFKVDELIVFASLPDMGRVGGLVSTFLAENLETERIAEIISSDKPWVSYSNGIVKTALDIYNIYYNKPHKLLILTGSSQPQEPMELYKLCNTFLDYVQATGKINLLYGAGGYLREQLTGAPKVCGVVNNPELKKVLKMSDIPFVGNEVNSITWFNGLILGLSADRNIDAIGLFGEISETMSPQPLAAKSIVKAFAKIENIKLDTKPLDKQYEAILEDIQKEKKQPSRFRPGIG
jgi:proteasome assembly chaperone (PAC2) family protein